MTAAIPQKIHGNPVTYYARLPYKALPNGYLVPTDGRATLKEIDLIVISNGSGIAEEDQIYWVSCLDEDGKVVTGEMYYTLDSAFDFPRTEYGFQNTIWHSFQP